MGSTTAHVIIGDGAENVLSQVGSMLRSRTIELAGKLDGREYQHYSPWMAGRPALPASLPDTLNYLPATLQEEVIVCPQYLTAVTNYLDEHPELRVELIGTRDDWSIAEDVAETRPGMVDDLLYTKAFVRGASPYFDGAYSALVDYIVPLKQQRARGWTLQHARGLVFLGFADGYDKIDLALDLVHEMGHQALALFQSVDPIFVSDATAPVYSLVRKTHRPAIQSLHAAAAIAFMTKFLTDIGELEHKHPDFKTTLPETLELAINALRENCEFTPLGEQIVSDFAATGMH